MESSFRIARVGGIDIGANWSWLIVAALIVWSLATALFPATYPDLDGGVHLAMAVVTAILFFGSILLHELGHALRALRERVPIEGITLWVFGGVARMGGQPPSPGAAFRVSAAGPVVSLALALVFGAGALAGARLDAPDAVQGVVDYLFRINVLVLAFNLVPALPLDGGRILQAWLWHRTGRRTDSTLQAASAGRAFGWLLVAVGLLGVFSAGGLGGIWLVFIGWFLIQAANAEGTHALLRRSLGSTRVRDVMTPDPITVPPDEPVGDLIDEAWQARRSTYPVVAGGDLVGLVRARDAAAVDPGERRHLRVRDIMIPRTELSTVDADDELADVVEGGAFTTDGSRRPVMEGGRLVGVLAPSDVGRAIELGGPHERGRADVDTPGPPGRHTPVLVWVLVGVVFLAVAGFLYTPPVVVLSPGETVAVEEDITIDSAATTEVDGDYRLTSVAIDRPNALGALIGWIRPDRTVLPVGEVVPRGVDADDYFDAQQEVFDESRRLAAIAGARAAGYDVPVSGDGAEVVGVVPDSPAADVLEPGDVIVSVDGTPVATTADLREAVRGREAGTELTLTVDQADAGEQELTVETASLPDLGGDEGLGVIVTTRDLTADLPFDVSFPDRDIGGPSAGLAYALAVTDLLSEDDLADGRTIAATGTIGTDGGVGAVGGVDLKAIAAENAGADVFVVPEANADDADEPGLDVRTARSLDEALDLLRTTA